jgi:hypothetical protein
MLSKTSMLEELKEQKKELKEDNQKKGKTSTSE